MITNSFRRLIDSSPGHGAADTAGPSNRIAHGRSAAVPRTRYPVLPAILLTLLPASWCAAGAVLFVDDDAPGGDGTTWRNAFSTLQEAFDAASPGTEIRVAQGIYKPDQGPGHISGSVFETFQLPDGVILKGGYLGFDQVDPEIRNPDAYVTVLSGDLNDDDALSMFDDNSAHVLEAFGLTTTVVVDGFRIISGNAKNSNHPAQAGGGMKILNAPATINLCTFSANRARRGGGLSVQGDSVVDVTDCSFLDNVAQNDGGGSYVAPDDEMLATVTYRRCSFLGNEVLSDGAGIAFEESNPCLVEHCLFRFNISTARSSALSFLRNDGTVVSGCLIIDNSALDDFQSSVVSITDSTPIFVNCTIANNLQNPEHEAIRGFGGDETEFYNCILRNNSGVEIRIDYKMPGFRLYNCLIDGGWPGDGLGNLDADPQFVNPVSDFRLLSTSPAIDAGLPTAPGLTADDLDGNPRIQQCRPDIGAYETPFFLDCDTDGQPDGCETETDPSIDCNENGVPDPCDLSSGYSDDVNSDLLPDDCEVDCNNNGLPDSYEIVTGLVDDCTQDGVPDECQFPINYRYSDSSAESVFGGGFGDVLWLTRFTVEPGHEVVSSIIVASFIANESAVFSDTIVLLYSDPNNDGHPSDAQLLGATPLTTIPAPIPVPLLASDRPTYVGEAGDNFFVGAFINHDGTNSPAAFDEEAPEMRSFLRMGDAGSIDLLTASGGSIFLDIGALGGNGAWILYARSELLDCDLNGIDDRCDITMFTHDDLNANFIPDICERSGDVNLDTTVDVTDLLLMLSSWGDCRFCPTDIDWNEQVNVTDLLILLANWD